MGFADMLLGDLERGDPTKVRAWVRANVIAPTIEELFMPHNLERLAAAIASEVRRQGGE